jgi:uncharacterized RDD family membrane protein YckC
MASKLLNVPTYINIPLGFEIADIGKRALAFIIDLFIKVIYFLSVLKFK